MTALTRGLLELRPEWYYAILFALFVAEGTSLPFLHLPAVVMFLAAALLISAGKVSLVACVLAAAAGSAAGGLITYYLGRRLARRPGQRAGWPSPERTARVTRLVARHGALVALAARWLGVLRPAALLGTGLAGVSPYKVGPALLAGSVVYCAVYQVAAVSLGALALRHLRAVDVRVLVAYAAGLGLVWLASLYLARRMHW